jgi:hypothetical protein
MNKFSKGLRMKREREKINNEILFTAIFRQFFVCMINYHLKFILHKHIRTKNEFEEYFVK